MWLIQGWHEYQWYISTIYNDSIMIFSSEKVIFSIFLKYQPLLLLLFSYFSNSCISSTNCSSPSTIRWCKIIAEKNNYLRWVHRHRRQTQTDGSCHKANVTYSIFHLKVLVSYKCVGCRYAIFMWKFLLACAHIFTQLILGIYQDWSA